MALIFNVVNRLTIPKKITSRTRKYTELANVLAVLDSNNALEISMKDNPGFKYAGIYSFIKKRFGPSFMVSRRKDNVGTECIYITKR